MADIRLIPLDHVTYVVLFENFASGGYGGHIMQIDEMFVYLVTLPPLYCEVSVDSIVWSRVIRGCLGGVL